MAVLVALIVLPLALIITQVWLGVTGAVCYSIYKIAFLVPPVVYCLFYKVSIPRDVLKLGNWRNGLKAAFLLGCGAIAIFWGVYWALGDLLLDKEQIVEKIGTQFSVDAGTVFLIAPITILLNSLLEEFFYRGFGFGLLVRRHAAAGYLLPAAVFTAQHMLFIYHWASLLPLLLAVAGLLVFALVAARLYAAADTIVAPWLLHVFGDVAMMGIAVVMLYPARVGGG